MTLLAWNDGTAAEVMAADWLIRVHTPAWLRLAGLVEQADRLEALPEITSFEDTVPLLRAIRADAAAAWAAAAPADAVWDAAGDTRAVAGGTAWAAAGSVAWGALEAAGGVAASDAAWDVAGDAARDATRAAWDAAWVAAGAGDDLQPTVEQLQASARDLFSRAS